MCLGYFKNIVKSSYKETHLCIHLKNDKPTHNSFNIISYDRTRFKDIHLENNAIKGFEWITLLLCFCLNSFVSCYNFSKGRIPLYILIKCMLQERTQTWKTGYIGKRLAINRAMKNFSCNCQQFTNSHDNIFVTISRPRYYNHCIIVIMSIRET